MNVVRVAHVVPIVHVEFLVEEQSAEAALNNLLPKLLPEGITFQIHPYNGKHDLLSKLPDRLRAYRKWLPDDWRIAVLIDEDRQSCQMLKRQMEKAAIDAGFMTKSMCRGNGIFQVVNRLAIEELESWFLGDVDALIKAYPKVPRTLGRKSRYRDPDAITGGTWEALERILKRAGYYPTGLPKVETARSISRHMIPQRNHSKSFQVFKEGIHALIR